MLVLTNTNIRTTIVPFLFFLTKILPCAFLSREALFETAEPPEPNRFHGAKSLKLKA